MAESEFLGAGPYLLIASWVLTYVEEGYHRKFTKQGHEGRWFEHHLRQDGKSPVSFGKSIKLKRLCLWWGCIWRCSVKNIIYLGMSIMTMQKNTNLGNRTCQSIYTPTWTWTSSLMMPAHLGHPHSAGVLMIQISGCGGMNLMVHSVYFPGSRGVLLSEAWVG